MKESMKDSAGLPVGIEICSLPFKEELILKIMKVIEKGARFHEKYPYPNLS
jgi:Asp-tRNA(Asn)/Glu-tRNA(Gln) amidotransferase A subunit family amidase